MTSFNKMFMVSAQQLNNLIEKKKSQSESINVTAQNDLERKMEAVLNESGTSVYEKAKRYNILLQKLLALVRASEHEDREIVLKLPRATTASTRKSVEGESTETQDESNGDLQAQGPSATDEILQLIPERSKKNVSYILQKLQESAGTLTWTPSGEVSIRGKPIKGSHILDLVKTLSQQQRSRVDSFPAGWESFLNVISELNIPLTSISNVYARKQIQHLKENPTDTNRSAPYTRSQRKRRVNRNRKKATPTAYSSDQVYGSATATPMQDGDAVFETSTNFYPPYQLWSSPFSPNPKNWLHFTE